MKEGSLAHPKVQMAAEKLLILLKLLIGKQKITLALKSWEASFLASYFKWA